MLSGAKLGRNRILSRRDGFLACEELQTSTPFATLDLKSAHVQLESRFSEHPELVVYLDDIPIHELMSWSYALAGKFATAPPHPCVAVAVEECGVDLFGKFSSRTSFL